MKCPRNAIAGRLSRTPIQQPSDAVGPKRTLLRTSRVCMTVSGNPQYPQLFGRGGYCERIACGIARDYRMRRIIMRAKNSGLMIVWTGL
jgi:hypothetical protein